MFRPLLLLLALLLSGIAEAAPKRVLIIHSFGRDFAPFNSIAPAFRTELARELKQPVAFHEISLDAERSAPPDEQAIVEFLRNQHGASPPDLVVVLAAAGLSFYLRHRDRLFPDTPVLVTGIDQRRLKDVKLGPRDRVISSNVDSLRMAQNILDVLPGTDTVAVVVGSSALEGIWLRNIENDLAPLAGRLKLLSLRGLTLPQLRERVAALRPGTAILYGFFSVDANGVPYENERALAEVRAASSVPVFGFFDAQFGDGIVGGPLLGLSSTGTAAGMTARRILEGDGSVENQVLGATAPVFDWRELERWNIPESRLPPGAVIRFRPPSLWDEHRIEILAALVVLVSQTVLITALLFQRARRRRAESEAVGLTGRLLTAHEDERKRLARELHDDLTQRLARLAIDAARLERGAGAEGRENAIAMREDLVRLSEDVHALSYRLHPSVLDDLGLVEALRAECDRVARSGALRVDVDAKPLPASIPSEASLCLFRIAQEALSNAARHASASAVTVLLERSGRGLQLAVSDNGAGFDPGRARTRASLGLASMRERVRLLHGALDIESTPGRGTTVVAWIPA